MAGCSSIQISGLLWRMVGLLWKNGRQIYKSSFGSYYHYSWKYQTGDSPLKKTPSEPLWFWDKGKKYQESHKEQRKEGIPEVENSPSLHKIPVCNPRHRKHKVREGSSCFEIPDEEGITKIHNIVTCLARVGNAVFENTQFDATCNYFSESHTVTVKAWHPYNKYSTSMGELRTLLGYYKKTRVLHKDWSKDWGLWESQQF